MTSNTLLMIGCPLKPSEENLEKTVLLSPKRYEIISVFHSQVPLDAHLMTVSIASAVQKMLPPAESVTAYTQVNVPSAVNALLHASIIKRKFADNF